MVESFISEKNFEKGFMVDQELLGGIAKIEGSNPESYSAFVVSQVTGECVEYRLFESVGLAVGFLQSLNRGWAFESTKNCGKSCGSGSCGSCH